MCVCVCRQLIQINNNDYHSNNSVGKHYGGGNSQKKIQLINTWKYTQFK